MTSAHGEAPERAATSRAGRRSEGGGGWVTGRIGAGSYRTEVQARAHAFVTDEPAALGGADTGPTPNEYLLGALGGCMAITLRMYADRKGWPLEEVRVRLRTSRSRAQDSERGDGPSEATITWLEREIELAGPLTEEQRQRLLQIADRCPVKRTLEQGIRVEGAS